MMMAQHSNFILETFAFFQLRINQLLHFGLIARFTDIRFVFIFLFDLPVFPGDTKPERFQAGLQSR